MLESLKTGKHPITLGPVVIHGRKTYQTYYTFASRISAPNPKLKDIKVIVTDGEEPLQNSLRDVFSSAQPLRSFRHVRQIWMALQKTWAFRQRSIGILSSIMCLDVYVKGLCDAEDEQEFRVMLDSFRKWSPSIKRSVVKVPKIYSLNYSKCDLF